MALDYSIIGQRIQKARLKKNITQEKLAEELDVTTAVISRIECGKYKINLTRLSEICHILNVTEGSILNGTFSNSDIYLDKEFKEVLKSCTTENQQLILEIVKAISEKLNSFNFKKI